MEIRYGKFYKTRDGRKVGPIKKSPYGVGWLTSDGFEGDQWYSSLHKKDGVEGRCYYGKEDPLDLIEEWIDYDLKEGVYGEVLLRNLNKVGADILIDNYLTPYELREAALLFNQLATKIEKENA